MTLPLISAEVKPADCRSWILGVGLRADGSPHKSATPEALSRWESDRRGGCSTPIYGVAPTGAPYDNGSSTTPRRRARGRAHTPRRLLPRGTRPVQGVQHDGRAVQPPAKMGSPSVSASSARSRRVPWARERWPRPCARCYAPGRWRGRSRPPARSPRAGDPSARPRVRGTAGCRCTRSATGSHSATTASAVARPAHERGVHDSRARGRRS